MQPGLRKVVTAFLLAVALVLGWQQPPALACVMDDAGCRDHCAIVATSCATSCPAPIAPTPVGSPARGVAPEAIVFSFDLPALTGRSISPDTGPPRTAA